MWLSERHQSEVIRELLARVRLEHLWEASGPTTEACRLIDRRGGPLSHGQTLMLRVAFDLWNGGGKATVGELLATLDEQNLRAVCDAMLARDFR